ncbi:MAG: DUF4129 domain-containing protein [Rhodospirillales bacterium]|jgi:hypothetical protein|nr:DUF4129 domain-containing protein [Rhodospirillales bacterium]
MPIARRDLRHAFFMAMEASWLFTLLAFLDAVVGAAERPPAAWALWLYPAAYACVRIETRIRMRPLARLALRILLGGGTGLATLTAIFWQTAARAFAGDASPQVSAVLAGLTEAGAAPVIMVASASVFIAARGWLLGPRQLDGDGFLAGLQLGAVILLAIAFLHPLAGLPAAIAIAGTLAFLGAGLYGLWLCRWLDSEMADRAPGGVGWPILAAMIVAGILVVGGLWWTEVDRGLIDWLLTPVFWLGDALNRLLLFLSQFVPEHRPLDMPPPPPPVRQMPPGGGNFNRFSEWTRLIGQILLTISVSLLAVLLVVRNLSDLMRWLSRRPRPARGIEHDPSSFGLWDDLRDILSILGRAARRLAGWLAFWRRNGAAEMAEIRAVRHIYARLAARMASRGWPRAIGQTPNEYLKTLTAVAPHLQADLALITEAYVGVRYGDTMPLPHQLAAVRIGWRRIRRAKTIPAKTQKVKEDPSCVHRPLPT